MSHMHNGCCGFCGTAVDRNFVTCIGCGATWRTVVSGWGVLLVQASWILAIPATIVAWMTIQVFAAGMITFVGVTLILAFLGLHMRITTWFR